MSEIKTGDLVVCVAPDDQYLVKGGVYRAEEVREVNLKFGNSKPRIRILGVWWRLHRFELADENHKKWVINQRLSEESSPRWTDNDLWEVPV